MFFIGHGPSDLYGWKKEVCLFHIYLTIFFFTLHGKFVSSNIGMIMNVEFLTEISYNIYLACKDG